MKNDKHTEYEQEILDAYHVNAQAWSNIVERQGIPSRRLVTNEAIYSVIESYKPTRILDVGCGEGWLSRALARPDRFIAGVDGVPALIEQARKRTPPEAGIHYGVYDYKAIANGELRSWKEIEGVQFDVAVCNFSIIGERHIVHALARIPIITHGVIIIQTLHPMVANGSAPYQDGWREGSWAGFGDEFTKTAPWYFRTISSWIELLDKSALSLVSMAEPIHPETQQPASLILTACKMRDLV